MVILANKNIPKQALQHFLDMENRYYLQTKSITYPAISGHPDIFFCPMDDGLVIAPNVPKVHKVQFSGIHKEIAEGYKPVGIKYPETARYNCVVTDDFLIGNTELIDKKILELSSGKEIINTKQGYTRCNLLPLEDNRFITSDRSIEKALVEKGLEVLYVNPEGIQLPGFEHGFIGGAAGIYKDQVFFIGNLDHYSRRRKNQAFFIGI